MAKKIGRNDKCPCSSGLKYKKCCLSINKSQKYPNSELLNNLSLNAAKRSIVNAAKIQDSDNSFYRIFWDDKVENVNPIKYYKDYEVEKRAIMFKDLLQLKAPMLLPNLPPDFFHKFAKEQIEKEQFWEKKENTEIHENFLKLFLTNKKREQISLLKGLSINPDQLISLIFKAFKEHGLLYSRYRFEHLPKGLDEKQKPIIADISEKESIITVGNTNLSDGQIKNMIEHRKVIIAHFFDKDNEWHCLFTTYNSLDGRENWKGGQPHFHYISSTFGISRVDFIKSMETGQYKSTSVHIDLLDYGNQPNTESISSH